MSLLRHLLDVSSLFLYLRYICLVDQLICIYVCLSRIGIHLT